MASLRGIMPGTTMRSFHSADGTFIPTPASGVVAGAALDVPALELSPRPESRANARVDVAKVVRERSIEMLGRR